MPPGQGGFLFGQLSGQLLVLLGGEPVGGQVDIHLVLQAVGASPVDEQLAKVVYGCHSDSFLIWWWSAPTYKVVLRARPARPALRPPPWAQALVSPPGRPQFLPRCALLPCHPPACTGGCRPPCKWAARSSSLGRGGICRRSLGQSPCPSRRPQRRRS